MESNPRPVANLIALMDPLDSITDSATPWAALSNDTTTGALTDKHLTGTKAISFAKVNGAANTIFGCIAKTIPAISLGDTNGQTVPGPRGMIRVAFYLSSITDVAYAFVRLGTDADNYNEWRVADSAITAAEWKVADIPISSANYSGITGTGWNPKAITYIAVGVAFDAETNTLSGIVFDHLAFSQSIRTDSAEAAQVLGVVTLGAGTAAIGSVTVTGDALTALQLIDNAISGTEMQVDVVAPLPAGTNSIGKVTVDATDYSFVHAEDDPTCGAHWGAAVLAVRQSTPANTSGTNADYEFLQMDSGALWVAPGFAAPSVVNADISADYTRAAIDCRKMKTLQIDFQFADDSAGELYIQGSSVDGADFVDIKLEANKIYFVTGGVAWTGVSFTGPDENITIADPGAGGSKVSLIIENPPAYVRYFFDRTGGSATGLDTQEH